MTIRAIAAMFAVFGFILLVAGCAPDTASPAATKAPEPTQGEQAEESVAVTDPPVTLVTPVAPVDRDSNAFYAMCAGEVKAIGDILEPIVANMVGQKIPYAQAPYQGEWRDCSGNFLRLSSYLASACPEHLGQLAAPPGIRDYTPGGNNKAPDHGWPRDTRQIAEWYEKQGRFIPIYYDGINRPEQIPADLLKNKDRVRPGSVLWFSKGRPLADQGTAPLFRKGSGTHIVHMATVTTVRVDPDSGEVTGFEMYHGRNKNHPGMVTKRHYWEWPESFTRGGKQYPPFGNWSQNLVGIATILPEVES